MLIYMQQCRVVQLENVSEVHPMPWHLLCRRHVNDQANLQHAILANGPVQACINYRTCKSISSRYASTAFPRPLHGRV